MWVTDNNLNPNTKMRARMNVGNCWGRCLVDFHKHREQTNLSASRYVSCHLNWFPFVTNEMSDIEQSNGITFLLLCPGATNCYDSTKVYSTNLTFNYLLFLTLWYHKPNLTGTKDSAAYATSVGSFQKLVIGNWLKRPSPVAVINLISCDVFVSSCHFYYTS